MPCFSRIYVSLQPTFPGDRDVERRIKSLIRWNAMAMVVRANQSSDENIGGHISTYASAPRTARLERLAGGASVLVDVPIRLARIVPVTDQPLESARHELPGSIVYQQVANDFVSLAGVAAIVGLVALSACWQPARRALGVNAATALNPEERCIWRGARAQTTGADWPRATARRRSARTPAARSIPSGANRS
jgi:hypothetical protein